MPWNWQEPEWPVFHHPAAATRDLADFVAKGALIRTGQRKGTRYHLNLSGSEDRG